MDTDKFEQGLKQMGVSLSSTEMRELIETLDWNGDGDVRSGTCYNQLRGFC